jgi:phasin family protein
MKPAAHLIFRKRALYPEARFRKETCNWGTLPNGRKTFPFRLQWVNCNGLIVALQQFFSCQSGESFMSYTNEQFLTTQKNSVQALASLSEKTFKSFEKLVDLNMAASKAILGESFSGLHALASAKDAQAVLSVQSSLLQPMAEKAASYSRHLYDIASGATADLSKTFESTSAQSQKSVTAFLENSLKNAPAGSEAAVAVIKSAMSASSNAVESAQKAAQQAAKLVESNMSAVTGQRG